MYIYIINEILQVISYKLPNSILFHNVNKFGNETNNVSQVNFTNYK